MSCATLDKGKGALGTIRLESQRVVDAVCDPGYHQYCPGEAWTPAMNLYQDDRNYYAVVNLAGVGCQAIEMDISEGRLIIAGHRPTPPPPAVHGKLELFHMEIDHGRFSRVLNLPDDVDTDKIEAVYRAGQLLITIPKVRL